MLLPWTAGVVVRGFYVRMVYKKYYDMYEVSMKTIFYTHTENNKLLFVLKKP